MAAFLEFHFNGADTISLSGELPELQEVAKGIIDAIAAGKSISTVSDVGDARKSYVIVLANLAYMAVPDEEMYSGSEIP